MSKAANPCCICHREADFDVAHKTERLKGVDTGSAGSAGVVADEEIILQQGGLYCSKCYRDVRQKDHPLFRHIESGLSPMFLANNGRPVRWSTAKAIPRTGGKSKRGGSHSKVVYVGPGQGKSIEDLCKASQGPYHRDDSRRFFRYMRGSGSGSAGSASDVKSPPMLETSTVAAEP